MIVYRQWDRPSGPSQYTLIIKTSEQFLCQDAQLLRFGIVWAWGIATGCKKESHEMNGVRPQHSSIERSKVIKLPSKESSMAFTTCRAFQAAPPGYHSVQRENRLTWIKMCAFLRTSLCHQDPHPAFNMQGLLNGSCSYL